MEQSNHDYNPVKIYSSFRQSGLVLAKMVLEREGIKYEMSNENFGGLYSGSVGIGTVDIYVDEKDAERAKEALKSQFEDGEEE